jgi:hypothetical protein
MITRQIIPKLLTFKGPFCTLNFDSERRQKQIQLIDCQPYNFKLYHLDPILLQYLLPLCVTTQATFHGCHPSGAFCNGAKSASNFSVHCALPPHGLSILKKSLKSFAFFPALPNVFAALIAASTPRDAAWAPALASPTPGMKSDPTSAAFSMTWKAALRTSQPISPICTR